MDLLHILQNQLHDEISSLHQNVNQTVPEQSSWHFTLTLFWWGKWYTDPHSDISSLSSGWLAVWVGLLLPWCLVPQSCLTLCEPMDCSPPGSSVHGTEDVQCTSVSPTLQEDFYPLRHQGSPKLLASSSHWPLLFILLHSYKLTYGFSRINSFLDPRLCSLEVFSTLNTFSCTTSRNKDLRYTETYQTTSSISPWLLLFQINCLYDV